MKLDNLLKWLPIVYLTFQNGDSMYQSGSTPILDDEDFVSLYLEGSGNANKANTVAELQDEVLPVADGTTLVWMTENDRSAGGREVADEETQGNSLFIEKNEISDLYIDDEEMITSGMSKDPFEEGNDFRFVPVNAIDIAKFDDDLQDIDLAELDSSGLLLDTFANQQDEKDLAYDPENSLGADLGLSIEVCQVKSCPNSCPEEYRVDEKTGFAAGDIMYMAVSDKNISDGEVLSIENAGFACDDENNFRDVNFKSGCKVDWQLIVESTVGSVSCLSVRMPPIISCPKAHLRVEVASCPVANVEMCVNNATILRCASTFSRRLKRSWKPYAKGGVAFNARYKDAGKMTIKLFPDVVEARPVSSYSNSGGNGQAKAVVSAISPTVGILLCMGIVCTIYLLISRYNYTI